VSATPVTPAVASLEVPVIALTQLLKLEFAGLTTATAGAVVSKVKLVVALPAFVAASLAVMLTSYCWPLAKVTELTFADQVEKALPVFEALKTVAVALVPVKLLPFQ
jgi:hypothetical protein